MHLRGLQLTVDIYEGTFESTKVLSKVLSYFRTFESTIFVLSKVQYVPSYVLSYLRTLLFISYESTFEGTKVQRTFEGS